MTMGNKAWMFNLDNIFWYKIGVKVNMVKIYLLFCCGIGTRGGITERGRGNPKFGFGARWSACCPWDVAVIIFWRSCARGNGYPPFLPIPHSTFLRPSFLPCSLPLPLNSFNPFEFNLSTSQGLTKSADSSGWKIDSPIYASIRCLSSDFYNHNQVSFFFSISLFF